MTTTTAYPHYIQQMPPNSGPLAGDRSFTLLWQLNDSVNRLNTQRARIDVLEGQYTGASFATGATFGAANYYYTVTGITANAGGGQASATLLTGEYNNITICTTAGDSVKLEPAASGGVQVVKNNGAAAVAIFPLSGDGIDSLAADTSITIQPGAEATFFAIDATTWQSSLSGSTFAARNNYFAATGITAFAGGGQGSATVVTAEYNNVTTCATAADSVKLPVASLGARMAIKNNGAADLAVFPATSGTINSGSVNASITIPVGSTKVFEGTTSLNWDTYGILTTSLGSVSRPSHTFNSQSNQGIYSISSTQMGFAVGGALATLVDTSGIKSDSVRNRVNIGTTPVGTVSIVEYGDGRDITTVLTLTAFIVGTLAGAGAALGVGNIVYAFPAGMHAEIVYSLSSIALTATGTAVATKTGLGSVIASGAVSGLSGTATFQDRLSGQDITTGSGGGTAVSALTAATAGIGTGIALNVAASVKNVFLNSAGTWNVNNTGNLTATGTIVIKWTKMS